MCNKRNYGEDYGEDYGENYGENAGGYTKKSLCNNKRTGLNMWHNRRRYILQYQKLRSKGVLRRVGGDKGGHWKILI